jgi:hypothetical protein
MKLTAASLPAGRSHPAGCPHCRWQERHPSGLMAEWCSLHRRRHRQRALRALNRLLLAVRR